MSQVGETAPKSVGSQEQIKTQQDELPPATSAEQPTPEQLSEPVAVSTEPVASPSASVVESKPQEFPSRPEPPKAESHPEVSPAVTGAEIKSKVSEVGETVPPSVGSKEQPKTQRDELPPATTAEQPTPEKLSEPVAVATEPVASPSASVVESKPQEFPSHPEAPKAESHPEVRRAVAGSEIRRRVSEVSETVPLSSSASTKKRIKTEREELPTAATTAEQPRLPEELPEPVAVATESIVSSSAAVEVKSQPQKLPASTEPPKTESTPFVRPEVAPPTTNIPSAELQGISDAVDQSWIEPLDEEEETLTQPIFEAPAREETLPNIISPVASPRSAVPSTPTVRRSAVENAPAFAGSTLGLSSSITREDTTEVRNLKRCPKCNTVYQNTYFSYCSRDSARLIGINEVQVVASANPSTPVAVWLLIAFVLGASAFAAYRLTQYLYRAEETAPATVATTPEESPAEVRKPFFTIGGDLAGMEVNVPEPPYPSELQGAGVTGPITVTIRVNRYGRVISAASSNGDRRLRSAAVRAARQATFAPDKLAAANRRSGVVAGTITYEFAPPQPVTAPSTAPTQTDNSSATNATNADPNAPVISDSLAAAALNVPAAEYPSSAQRAGVDGKITVTIRVNRKGKVISWRTSAGDSQLRAAAIRAARKATFSPEKLQGTGEVLGTITYNFTP